MVGGLLAQIIESRPGPWRRHGDRKKQAAAACVCLSIYQSVFWSIETTAQIRIGMTTYLKPGCSGTVIRALELLSCSSIFTISTLMLASASIR